MQKLLQTVQQIKLHFNTLTQHLKKHPQLGVHRTKNTTPIRDLLLNWIVSDGQSFKVVENEHFINLLSSISIDNIDIPSADINLKSAAKKERVMNVLKISDSVVNLTFDIWSNNFTSFLCICAHFINNFVPHNIFIKMREMEKEHTGEYIANLIFECLSEYQIVSKFGWIVTDNVSYNFTAMKFLAKNSFIYA